MEPSHHRDHFEKYLREKAEDFIMYPSKRVWYSIYNNMHPGNRLPSVSMSIILIATLFLIGFLNTNVNTSVNNSIPGSGNPYQIVDAGQEHNNPGLSLRNGLSVDAAFDNFFNNTLTADAATTINNFYSEEKAYSGLPAISSLIVATPAVTMQPTVHSAQKQSYSSGITTDEPVLRTTNSLSPEHSVNKITVTTNSTALLKRAAKSQISFDNTLTNTVETIDNTTMVNSNDVLKNNTTSSTSAATESVKQGGEKEAAAVKNNVVVANTKTAQTDIANSVTTTGLSVTDRAWIDNYALYNKRTARKWAGKLSMQAYVTPSIVYRKLRNNSADNILTRPAGSFNSANVDALVNHKPSFGVETGIALHYDLFNRIKVKAGVQLNYTRYNAHTFDNLHPVSTSIMMRNEDNNSTYELYRTSSYSNAGGMVPVKLHNETYQLSVPVGVDLKLLAINKFSWYAGATLQPTFVAAANSYLISADRHSYAKDPTLLNRFNLNAGFETYLAFDAHGYTWQLGPQFRSQIFSTNTKMYSVEERLVNFGFKVGISKKF